MVFMTVLPIKLQAEPAPFGLVLNKTTIQELKNQFAATSIGINKNNGMEAFDIPPDNIHLDGLISARAAFSKEGILKLFQMSLPATKFDEMVQSLAKKYSLLYKNVPPDGNKEAKFLSDNTYILLYAQKDSTDMDFLYINKQILDETLKVAANTTKAPTAEGEVPLNGTEGVDKNKDMISQL
jgi:hypothetical protein